MTIMQHLINECHELFVPEQLNCHRFERPLSENIEVCFFLDYCIVYDVARYLGTGCFRDFGMLNL